IFSNRLTLSGGRSSRGSGMRRSICRAGWVSVVTGYSPWPSGLGGDDVLQGGVVQVHLHGMDFIPRKTESLEFALECGLVVRLVDGHDEAAEHIHPHLFKPGLLALQDGTSV